MSEIYLGKLLPRAFERTYFQLPECDVDFTTTCGPSHQKALQRTQKSPYLNNDGDPNEKNARCGKPRNPGGFCIIMVPDPLL